jgi:hypothetical protein
MPKHEYFEELCAVAGLGEASGAELADLRDHLPSCSECQKRFADFEAIHSAQFANASETELSREQALNFIDSPLLRRRFLQRAESQGIVFSIPHVVTNPVSSRSLFELRKWPSLRMHLAMAASLIVAAAFGTFYFVQHRSTHSVPITIAHSASAKSGSDHQLADRVGELQQLNKELTSELASARSRADTLASDATQLRQLISKDEQARLFLVADVEHQKQTIVGLQEALQSAQANLENIQSQLAKEHAATSENETTLVEAKVRVNELTEELAHKSKSLERENELFAADRDIRELMAARNLHIVDVFDTDTKGKTSPAFGRIFLTEGKSLLFYAYDLNDKRVQEAGYQYRIWGKREGPAQAAKSLGMFYSDDKLQKRWVFQYDDPKVLQEIDSVFVTLESPNDKGPVPKGQKLMYAYLRGQANHP